MNNPFIVYTYTSERLVEFKKEKSNNDIIISALNFANEKELEEVPESKKVYIDITNLYISSQENPLIIENIINKIKKQNNYYLLLNFNALTRFKSDFGQYIDDYIPIDRVYGHQDDTSVAFNNLTDEQISVLRKSLNDNLYGHNAFKEEFIKQIKNYSILYNLGELKIMSLLICGDSGVGKTELAKIIHNTFYKNSKIIKINLGNYKTQGAINSLIGSPKGYFGSERGGELSNKIKNSDSKVILIDEFEKADTDIFNFFYELLEDGKFTDLNENEFDLTGYLIIFTSNLNKSNYKDVIPSPLLSRFTIKVLFEPLQYATKNKYVRDKCKELVALYNKIYTAEINYQDVLELITKDTINSTRNFRYLNHIIQNALIQIIENNN